jgi:hypothetical protein
MSKYPYRGRIIGFIILTILSIVCGVVIVEELDHFASSAEVAGTIALVVGGFFAAFVSLALAEASIRRGVDYKIPGLISLVISIALLGASLLSFQSLQPSVERLEELVETNASKYRTTYVAIHLLEKDALEKGILKTDNYYFELGRLFTKLDESGTKDWAKKIDPALMKHIDALARKELEQCAKKGSYCNSEDTLAVARHVIAKDPAAAALFKDYVRKQWKGCADEGCREKFLALMERGLGKQERDAFVKARHEELFMRLAKVGVTKSEALPDRLASLNAAEQEYSLKSKQLDKIPEALAMRAAFEVHRAALLDTRPGLGESMKTFKLVAGDLMKERRDYKIDKSLTYLLETGSGLKVITREKDKKVVGAMLAFDYTKTPSAAQQTRLLQEAERWLEAASGTALALQWQMSKPEEMVLGEIPLDVKIDEKLRPTRVFVGDFPTLERAETMVWLASNGIQAEELDKLIRVRLAASGVSKERSEYDRYYASTQKKVEDDVAKRGYYSSSRMTSLVVIPIPTTTSRTSYRTKTGGYRPSSSYSNRAGSYRSSSSSSSRSSYSSGSYGSGK